MEWEFTPEEVVQGEIAYGLEEFRCDLFQEVNMNLSADFIPADTKRLFDLVYDICYWLATGRELSDFEREINADPVLVANLRMAHRHCKPNVEMLGAILQRSIMDGVEAGMPLEQALNAAAARHAEVTSS
jgi:hypothetical protein